MTTVEFVPLNGSNGSYQSVPLTENTESSAEVSDTSSRFLSKRVMMIGGFSFVVLALISVLVTFTANPAARSNPVMKESNQEASFCKTSCTNSCAEYKSVYGALCCDWSTTADGGKTCAQTISSEGVCSCGSSSKPSSASALTPTTTSIVDPGDSNKSRPVPEPVKDPKPKHNHDDWNNDWFPPSSWLPFPPFEPIHVPDSATACKKHCDNACGWSQSNGEALCCEPNSKGKCGMTQVNGKCYCG